MDVLKLFIIVQSCFATSILALINLLHLTTIFVMQVLNLLHLELTKVRELSIRGDDPFMEKEKRGILKF